MLILLIVAIFLYILGYQSKNRPTDLVVSGFFRKFFWAPRIIFLICASPKLEKYPAGVMVTGGLINQLMGIGFAIYALIFYTVPNALVGLGSARNVIEMVYLGVMVAASYFIPYWLSKKYPYKK